MFNSPSHQKSIFLKIRSFFPFKFFQGHNWLTNYLDFEFYGHWKTLTLSSTSPNASKHWRFLAFCLNLCFGNCLLFLVCHCIAFLLSTRAMTTLGCLPNALRDMVILVRPETGDCVIHKGSTQFSCVLGLCMNLLSLPNSIQYPGHFLFRVFNSRHDVHSASWRRYVTGIPSIFFMLIIISRRAFGRQPSVVIACVLSKNAIQWQTRNNRQFPKHKLRQNAKNLQCLLVFGLIEDNVRVFQWP